jgi:hypothetical protein
MNKHIFILFIWVIFIGSSFENTLLAQKRVLGQPEAFALPVDYADDPARYRFFLEQGDGTKSKEVPWLVFSDRENNPVYDRPDGTIVKEIGFKEHFFVVSERGDWIEIAKSKVNNGLKIVKGTLIPYGWVPKDKMLLWNSGLISERTGIHKKAVLLNRAEESKRVMSRSDVNLIKIFTNPSGQQEIDQRKILTYFFIYKKDLNSNRFLIGTDANLSTYNIDEQLIGWVDPRDCDIWDTRICLEPNFSIEGYNERKNNANLRIKGFSSLESAEAGAQGNFKREDVFWKYDPVIITEEKSLAPSNRRRFNGQVVRFPLADRFQKNGTDFYRSGVIGNIQVRLDNEGTLIVPEARFAQLNQYKNKLAYKANHVNVMLVVEGTGTMAPFRQNIIQALRGVERQLVSQGLTEVNYSALVYRDIPEEDAEVDGKKVNRLTEYRSFTSSAEDLVSFFQEVDFSNKVDRDDYTAMFYGLSQALQRANFRSDELNVILLLGNYGDFRIDSDRKAAAEGHPALYDERDVNIGIVQSLANIDAHLYAIQLQNDGFRGSRAFQGAAQYLIVEKAKFAFNEIFSNPDYVASMIEERLNLKPPSMSITDTEQIFLEGDGFSPGGMMLAKRGGYLSGSKVAKVISDYIIGSVDHMKAKRKIISGILNDQSIPTNEELLEGEAGGLVGGVAEGIYNALKETEGISLEELSGRKYRFFTEVYFPYKYVNAGHPLVSYILFMPERDLINYHNTIKRCTNIGSVATEDKKRELLFDVYKSLVEQFTGENIQKPAEEVTRAELKAYMQGVAKMGLTLDDKLDHRLGDVLDKRVVSAEMLDDLIKRFVEVERKLDTILRERDRGDFCYSTDGNNFYYWVALEDAF